MVYSTPNGDSFNELRSRIQAVGVALLFTYTVIIYSFLVEFSKQYANFLVMTLNSEVELIQLYSKGYLDEGVASGENWDYLMEDYGTDLIDLLEGSNL